MSSDEHRATGAEPRVLTEAEREAWPSAEPPDGFAARVVARRQKETSPPLPEPKPHIPHRGVRLGVVVMVAAAVMLLAIPSWWVLRARAAEGSLIATNRRSVALGDRAVAVAERGATLRWRVEADGAARVEQDAGEVFYRVDDGEQFEVVTPRGTVRVEGTCFTVEMETMSDDTKRSGGSMLRGGMLGAALASAAVVTVYEGRVAVADEGTELTVAAGQRARTGPGGGWRVDADDDDHARPHASSHAGAVADATDPVTQLRKQALAMERMRAANEAQRDQIEQLQAKLGDEAKGPEAKAREQAQRCAKEARAEGCSMADPDQDTLLELARCGALQVDIPGFINLDPAEPVAAQAGDWAQRMGLSDEEADALYTAAESFRDQRNAAMRALLAEIGEDPELADALPANALSGAIEAQYDREAADAIRRRMSRERAGLETRPVDTAGMSPTERYTRLTMNVGHDFETAVAGVLGPDTAHALRAAEQGWPGGTSVYSGRCEGE